MPSAQNDYSDDRCRKAGRALLEFDAVMQGYRQSQVELTGLSIRAPRVEGEDYLMTLRAVDDAGAPLVGWNGAYNLLELWISSWGRFSNGKLKWREDDREW